MEGVPMTTTMLMMMLCVALTSLLLLGLPSARAADTPCNLPTIRSSAQRTLMGGWRIAESGDEDVANLMQSATVEATSSSDGAAPLSRGQHIIEAYTQLVNGMNYCIRFSATGGCTNYHCKSYECIAKGHKARTATQVSVSGVECKEMEVCDIDRVRDSSETTLMGRWSRLSTDDDRALSLHQTASSIASVDKGSIVEAFKQLVQGQNYCIHFNAKATGNCGSHCEELSCVAGGYDPLPHDIANVSVVTKIGVQCQPVGPPNVLRASSFSSANTLMSAVVTTLTIVAAAMYCVR